MSETSNVETPNTNSAHAEDIQEQIRVYVLVFAALAVLTIVTVAVGYLRLPAGPAVALGLLIATVKGGLVAGYFMHLISEEKVIYIILGFTVFFLLGMIVIMTSSFYDQIG